MRNFAGIIIGIALNLYTNLGKIDILTTPNLLNQEPSVLFLYKFLSVRFCGFHDTNPIHLWLDLSLNVSMYMLFIVYVIVF